MLWSAVPWYACLFGVLEQKNLYVCADLNTSMEQPWLEWKYELADGSVYCRSPSGARWGKVLPVGGVDVIDRPYTYEWSKFLSQAETKYKEFILRGAMVLYDQAMQTRLRAEMALQDMRRRGMELCHTYKATRSTLSEEQKKESIQIIVDLRTHVREVEQDFQDTYETELRMESYVEEALNQMSEPLRSTIHLQRVQALKKRTAAEFALNSLNMQAGLALIPPKLLAAAHKGPWLAAYDGKEVGVPAGPWGLSPLVKRPMPATLATSKQTHTCHKCGVKVDLTEAWDFIPYCSESCMTVSAARDQMQLVHDRNTVAGLKRARSGV